MKEKLLRPAWVEIDLDAVEYNAINIKKLAGDCEPLAVMKSDAYGLGAPMIAKTLQGVEYRNFAVATLEEAIELRESGIDDRILILGLVPDENADMLVKYDITAMVTTYENALAFSDEAGKQGKTVECFVAIDTGMCRIGYRATDHETLVREMKKISELPHLKIYGIHSHFATADEADKTFSNLQLERFEAACNAIKDADINIPVRTIANSSAIIDMPETLKYEMCRPGFILYGVYPSDEVIKENLPLKSAMSVKAKVSYVKTIQPGDTVGYGRKFTATRETRIATLPLGFADGLPRVYSAQGRVIVNGKIAPMAGNICMDQCMIDVTDIDGVEVGTEVIIMGSDGINIISQEDIVASLPGMVLDELMGNLSHRMPRIYVRTSDPDFWIPEK